MIAETAIIIGIMFVVIMGPVTAMMVLTWATIKASARNPSAVSIYLGAMAVILLILIMLSIIALLIMFQLFAS